MFEKNRILQGYRHVSIVGRLSAHILGIDVEPEVVFCPQESRPNSSYRSSLAELCLIYLGVGSFKKIFVCQSRFRLGQGFGYGSFSERYLEACIFHFKSFM